MLRCERNLREDANTDAGHGCCGDPPGEVTLLAHARHFNGPLRKRDGDRRRAAWATCAAIFYRMDHYAAVKSIQHRALIAAPKFTRTLRNFAACAFGHVPNGHCMMYWLVGAIN